MPFDSNGVFSRVMNWTSDQQNGIAIECGRHDAEDDNFAQGFNDCFCRDGRAAATGDFNLGNYKLKNVANGTATTDAVNKGQLDEKATPAQVNTAISTMLSTLYPVGSIYIGTQASCPLSSLISGSTWELVAADKALWTGDGTNANTTIAAGLPNITGQIGITENEGNKQFNSLSGAFYDDGTRGDWLTGSDATGGANSFVVKFDASKSSAVYGASTTVQPPAYIVNVWRRTV
jgi:hypothetical protein